MLTERIIMKRLLPVLAFALLSLCATAQAAPDDRAGIAAIVNDDVITMTDVRNRMNLYLAGAPQPEAEALKKMEAQVLDKLIDERLEMREASTLGITVDAAQMDEAFGQIAKQNGFTSDEFKKKLTSQNVKPSALSEQVRAELAWSQVIKRKLRPQINVSEGEIDSAIDQKVRGKDKTRYHVAEIFLAVPDPSKDESVRSDAEKLVEQISKGASFSSVARQFSQAPGAAQGGDLGWVQEGQLDPKLDVALKQMQPGQISPPVKTDKGYDILFLRELQQPGGSVQAPPAPSPGVIVDLKQILIPASPKDPREVVNAKLARLQALKSEVTSCADLDKKAKQFTITDVGRGPLAGLPKPVQDIVGKLKSGEMSKPLFIEKGIAALMVCAREDAPAPAPADTAPKPGEDSREQVANRIGMQRLDQMQERYLRDLRATAFIDKRI